MSQQEDKDRLLWYFSFGSNMSSDVLSKRRKVWPKQSKPCEIIDYTIEFNMKGLPYFEPSFPSIVYKKGARVHGVAHQITRRDMDQIRYTEGGQGHDDHGYRECVLPAKSYSGEHLDVISLEACQVDIQNAVGSKRYMDILRKGAREHSLDPEWIKTLDNMEHYRIDGDMITKLRKYIGRYLFLILVLPLMLLPMLCIFLQITPLPKIFVVYMTKASDIVWLLHDNIFEPIFGSGKNNEDLCSDAQQSKEEKIK